MKYIILSTLAFLFIFPITTHADTIQCDSTIEHVTVYSDRALIERQTNLKIPAGIHSLIFENLPINIDDSTVQAEGSSDSTVTITGLHIEKTFLEQPGTDSLKKISQEIQAVKDAVTVIENRQKILQTERDFIQSLKLYADEKFSDEFTRQIPENTELTRILKYIKENLSDNYNQLFSLQKEKRERKKELEALQKKWQTVNNWKPKERKNVKVGIDTQTESTLQIKLSYIVYGATWIPSYSIRAFPKSEKLELTYNGLVRQKSGYNWKNIKLSLSTAKPSVYGRMPELHPWYIRPKSRMKDKFKEFTLKKAASPAPREMKMELLDQEADISTAAVEQKGTSISYNLTGLETILSDGNKYKTTISINKFPAETIYTATPELSEYVYLKAKIQNATDLHYLPGKAEIFMEQDFVGRSDIESIAPNEHFDIFLGIDEGVKIEKKLVKKDEEEKGFIGKKRQTKYIYKITAENYKTNPITLIITDGIPVSQHEDIIIFKEEFSIQPSAKTKKQKELQKQGIYDWELKLNPQEKKNITYSYSISFPQDMEVEGL